MVSSGETMKPQVDRSQYFSESYDSKERFNSYWHQVKEIIKLSPKQVLEIGVGNGFVSWYLKARKISVTTLDIDKNLNPDVVGNVLEMPLTDESFDVVVCYEVLEHLPYKSFNRALAEIFRVSKSHVVLSLPDASRIYGFGLRRQRKGGRKILIPVPRFKKPVHKFDSEHYWEIGKAGYPLKRIADDIKKEGFEILATYRVFEQLYHRFFVLRKQDERNL